MRKSYVFLLLLLSLAFEAKAGTQFQSDSLQDIPPQPIDSQYTRNFDFRHDKGFYLSVGFGPQWNQSIRNPAAGAFRFGGKIAVGFVPLENLAVHADIWGNFLEESSLLAVGPGVTYFLGDSNIALGASLGVGQAFSIPTNRIEKFKETVLAMEVSAGKYWWLSGSTSLGASFVTGVYGLTLSSGSVSSWGWHTGLRLEALFN